jgi:hypothetical protein
VLLSTYAHLSAQSDEQVAQAVAAIIDDKSLTT